MKKMYYLSLLGLALFEIANVYFIMPMPGSQRLDTIDVAYFLYSYRWAFRCSFILLILLGIKSAFSVQRKWIPALSLLPVLAIVYMFNFRMVADHMFLEPANLGYVTRANNNLNDSTLLVAVEHGGEAKAYPIRFIVYHHQVRDTLAGKEIMVTYCSVCRTGRVFEPLVNGKKEHFRLVGMDHFNAMFEDHTTGSWWRQVTGEAITGKLKGERLPELPSIQLTSSQFFKLYPFGKIMSPDTVATDNYDSLARFEKGKSKGDLTRTDSLSWKDKSWVIGIDINNHSKAYDWKELATHKVIEDHVGGTPVVLVLSSDGQSFAAFENETNTHFEVHGDTLISSTDRYNFTGKPLTGSTPLKRINAYQEFWHSWRTFHPNTEVYKADSKAVSQ